jgi:S1-C subfamily serine protease
MARAVGDGGLATQILAIDPAPRAALRGLPVEWLAQTVPACGLAPFQQLTTGDILIEFDSKPIQNLYDFTYALRSKKPGDEVLVKVLRGNETISATVLLTKRVE